jgi:glycosyltransferase involved in cell wall biosynthesis
MSFNVMITADRVGAMTGGGAVTFHEWMAMKTLGGAGGLTDRGVLELHKATESDPWCWDEVAKGVKDWWTLRPRLAHFYAGTFGETVKTLKGIGCKVTYTAAAHDVALSKAEHEKLGLPYNYPHLTEPDLLERYLLGYKEADCLICPSKHSASVMREFRCTNRIEIIPHGVYLPSHVASLPERFTVGYLGAVGPDKGLIYLLQAWKKLNYKDATLVIAGRFSTDPFVSALIAHFGGGIIHQAGWQENVSDFYNSLSLYVQPSVTEGFGIEVLEAMAHGRAVLCSNGAGSVDTVPEWYSYDPLDVDTLASKIDQVRLRGCCQPAGREQHIPNGYPHWESIASNYTWDKVRQQYVNLWKSLTGA